MASYHVWKSIKKFLIFILNQFFLKKRTGHCFLTCITNIRPIGKFFESLVLSQVFAKTASYNAVKS